MANEKQEKALLNISDIMIELEDVLEELHLFQPLLDDLLEGVTCDIRSIYDQVESVDKILEDLFRELEK